MNMEFYGWLVANSIKLYLTTITMMLMGAVLNNQCNLKIPVQKYSIENSIWFIAAAFTYPYLLVYMLNPSKSFSSSHTFYLSWKHRKNFLMVIQVGSTLKL